MLNNSSGAAALSQFTASNGTAGASFGTAGTGLTAYGILAANSGYIYTGNNFALISDGGYISFATAGATERLRVSSTGIIINNGSNTLALPTTRPGTNGYVPSFNTDGTFAAWVAASGGSGMTNPMTTAGDIIYGGTSGTPTRLGAGTSTYVLTSNGAGTAPSWQPAASGGGTSGTFTPTITNSVNVSASTSHQCSYTRVGNVVHVQGIIEIDPTTASTGALVLMTLPLSNNFSTVYEGSGAGSSLLASGVIEPIVIGAEPTLDLMALRIYPTTGENRSVYFVYTYILNAE